MGGIKENIYLKSPYILKVVLVNILGFKITRKRYNKDFEKYYKIFKRLWAENIDVVLEFQKERLKILLTEAYLYSEWYHDRMKEIGINEIQIQNGPIEVLKALPILKKEERKYYVDKIVNNKRKLDTIGYTSGTSGSPMINYLDVESTNIAFALWKRFHSIIGLDLKIRQVRFSGRIIVNPKRERKPFWIYNYFENQLLMSTYNLTDHNFPIYLKKLNKFKPELIDGFPSAIFILSKYINQNNIKLNFKLKAITVTSETLHDFQRIEIEKAFKCHVHNQYASSEGSPFITECRAANLHLNLDSGYFEFLNSKGDVAKPGEMAYLIVTSFRNLKTPLIRYNIGDMVILPKENTKCKCGCEMPIIERIIGREDDMLWTKEKGYVGIVIDVYKGLNGIVNSQIIQNSPNDVLVNMMIDKDFNDKTKQILLQNLKNRLGVGINYKINIVDNIPLSANGKFVAVKRNFKLT